MKRIDPETVKKILDTADIVEVVSDFVSLKRRGSGYIGLCPFHNERTPSFSVSKARGYCKCFSCGKGGSAVGFIMEHEQLSYGEALRWLANKYGIEVAEEELTPEQLAAATERESMLALNEFALSHFEHNLTETADGKAIGLSYFRERGLTDAAIKRFRLGYALERRDALAAEALSKGYSEKLLIETGLCGKSEHGSGLYDRFRGRVIYPVFALSGKVLAFGGRTLRKDKDVAKYVNSPESPIYHKSNQLYGLYQARRAIVNADKCILVEGYMDVISMSQRGVENVVASSGTSLTEGQISLIHRFTDNVTVIYDSDPAGIKASLRGIDMLLAEGMKIKVMLLPDGDDPDSFAQSHTLEEIKEYMVENETDFLRFKTRILLSGVSANDPIARSRVISDIIRSISVIPDEVERNEYIKECSRLLDTNESTVALQVAKYHKDALDKKLQQRPAAAEEKKAEDVIEPTVAVRTPARLDDVSAFMRPFELETLRLLLKYGFRDLCLAADESAMLKVIDYVEAEMSADDIFFSNPDIKSVHDEILALRPAWEEAEAAAMARLEAERAATVASRLAEAAASAQSVIEVQSIEARINEQAQEEYQSKLNDFSESFISLRLSSHPDDAIRRLSTNLVSEKYQLSKIHTKHARIETERDTLIDRVPKAVYGWKIAVVEWRQKELRKQLADAVAANDHDRVTELLINQQQLRQTMAELAKYLGERIVLPKR